jgi:hypothetical protein
LTITLTPEMERALADEAARQNKTPEQLAMEALLAGLRDRRVPQSLDELEPRKPLPPGKTLKDIIETLPKPDWSDDETDEKLLAALKAMDE